MLPSGEIPHVFLIRSNKILHWHCAFNNKASVSEKQNESLKE